MIQYDTVIMSPGVLKSFIYILKTLLIVNSMYFFHVLEQ